MAHDDASRVDYFRFIDSKAPFADDSHPQISVAGRWNIVHHALRIPGDSPRSSRAVKVLCPDPLWDYDITVWVDNRVRLKVGVEELVDRFLPDDADMAIPLHSFHQTLQDEFDRLLKIRFDDPRRIREQRAVYAHYAPHLLKQPVYWTAILIRRNNAAVRSLNKQWWEQILRYSRRDQLSFPLSREAVPELTLAPFAIDNYSSDVHEWLSGEAVVRRRYANHWQPVSLPTEFADDARFLAERLKRTPIGEYFRHKIDQKRRASQQQQ